jgi:hypothetical protein
MGCKSPFFIMGILEQARRDYKRITSSKSGFAVDIVLTSPTGEIATVPNLHSKHHLAVNDNGLAVNSKNAHIAFFESQVNAVNPLYVTRNARGEVYLKGHLVRVKDSTGLEKQYVIDQWFQNETLGPIICILGDYA